VKAVPLARPLEQPTNPNFLAGFPERYPAELKPITRYGNAPLLINHCHIGGSPLFEKN
jgi:hypothetical protein